MKYSGFLLILGFIISGCDNTIEEFVRGNSPGTNSAPSLSVQRPTPLKISPGANSVTGAQLKGRFAITTSQKTVKGTQVNAQISFHQNKTN